VGDREHSCAGFLQVQAGLPTLLIGVDCSLKLLFPGEMLLTWGILLLDRIRRRAGVGRQGHVLVGTGKERCQDHHAWHPEERSPVLHGHRFLLQYRYPDGSHTTLQPLRWLGLKSYLTERPACVTGCPSPKALTAHPWRSRRVQCAHPSLESESP